MVAVRVSSATPVAYARIPRRLNGWIRDVDIVCDMHQCMEICIIMEVHVWNGQQ